MMPMEHQLNENMQEISQIATRSGLAGLIVIAWVLGGCSGSGVQVTSNAPTTPAAAGTPAAAIKVAGSPAASVIAGTAYSFQPTVSGATAAVTFSITGRPAWASFNAATGAMGGTPTAAEVGSTGSITITASDGSSSASLSPFAIQVEAAVAGSPTGSASLAWAAPTHNTDGSPITGLAGYHIYYGTDQSAPSQTVDVPGATATSYVVQALAPGTYYFTVVAYNSLGVDSTDSNVAVKTI
jgi:putative Ig domain-containing protein